jgi:hypothetical protein
MTEFCCRPELVNAPRVLELSHQNYSGRCTSLAVNQKIGQYNLMLRDKLTTRLPILPNAGMLEVVDGECSGQRIP